MGKMDLPYKANQKGWWCQMQFDPWGSSSYRCIVQCFKFWVLCYGHLSYQLIYLFLLWVNATSNFQSMNLSISPIMTQMKCLECWWTISWISQVLLDLWMELAKLATRLLCTEMDVGTLSLRNIPGSRQLKTWNHWNHWNHCVTSFVPQKLIFLSVLISLFLLTVLLFCVHFVSTSQIFVSSIHWISGFTKAASAGSRSFSPRFWANCSARKALKVRLAISKSTLSCFKMKDDGTSEDFNLEKKTNSRTRTYKNHEKHLS